MEKKNSLLVTLLTFFIVTTIGLGGFVIYDKLIKDSKSETCSKDECESCNCVDSTCDKANVTGDQMLSAELGTVFVSSNGDVYFDPNESAKFFENEIDMRPYAKKLLGNPGSNEVKSDKFVAGYHTFDYKLNLSNVRSVSEFYFGNGGTNFTLLFIHNDGRVSELSYSDENLKLFKNVSGYSNIVSMVKDASDGGNGAKLYDRCGNGIIYYSPRFK